MHVYADSTGRKAVIIILSDDTPQGLDTLAKRLENEQRARDPDLQVVTNKTITVDGKPLQQLDSIIASGGKQAYSAVVLGKVDNHLLTMQVTLPADDQQKAQSAAESIIIRKLLNQSRQRRVVYGIMTRPAYISAKSVNPWAPATAFEQPAIDPLAVFSHTVKLTAAARLWHADWVRCPDNRCCTPPVCRFEHQRGRYGASRSRWLIHIGVAQLPPAQGQGH